MSFISKRSIYRGTTAATLSTLALLGGNAVFAQTPVTPGDLLVYRVGDGSAALSSASAAVFIDEYTQTGTLVRSIAAPTSAIGTNFALTATGNSTSEGGITLSSDGRYVSFGGYNTGVGTAGVAGTASTAVQRVAGILTLSTGALDTSTALTDAHTGGNIRDVLTTDGTNIYTAGSTGGVRYTTKGSTTSTQLETTPVNIRRIGIFSNQLYFSAQTGSFIGVSSLGSGVPTTSGQTATLLTGTNASTNPYDFLFTDANTLYIADQSKGLEKFTYSSATSTWSLSYASTITNFTGLTAGATANTFYATSGTNLYSVVDSGAALTTTSIATATTNEAFRSLIFAPAVSSSALPEPGSFALIGLGALAAAGQVVRRRRSA